MRTLLPLACAAAGLLAAPAWAAQQPATQPDPRPAPPTVWDRISFYGDLRLRHESDFNLPQMPSSRHHELLRARLGVIYDAAPDLTVEASVRTGEPDDPQNPYAELGGTGDGEASDSLTVSFDRINARYTQDSWWLVGGKFDHAFWSNPVYGELVWDADVEPEGLGGAWFATDRGLDSVRVVAGEYILLEQAAAEDAYATVVQVSGSQALDSGWKFDGALGYYHYYDATPGGSTVILKGENSGNATNPRGTDFRSQFGVLNPIVAFTWNGAARPVVISAEYIKNLRAEISEDQGYALGAAYGSTQAAGDWQLAYQLQVVEQDAVFTPFSNDDFPLATNYLGHMLSATYMFQPNVGLRVWVLLAQPDQTPPGGSDATQWRVRVDLTLTF